MDRIIASHRIDPARLREDDFEGFLEERRESLLEIIESAMGKEIEGNAERESPEDTQDDYVVIG